MSSIPPDLLPAARELEAIFAELHPGYTLVISGRKLDRADRKHTPSIGNHMDDAGTVPQNTHTISGGNTPATPSPAHKHRLEEAA